MLTNYFNAPLTLEGASINKALIRFKNLWDHLNCCDNQWDFIKNNIKAEELKTFIDF